MRKPEESAGNADLAALEGFDEFFEGDKESAR